MKITVHGIFLIFFAAIQGTWMNSFEFFNVIPNLFLVYAIVIGTFSGRTEAAAVGFAFGMMLDLLSGDIWGLYALLAMIMGFCVSHFCNRILGVKNIFLSLLIVLICSWLLETVYYLISFLSVENINLKYAVLNVVFPEGIYNVFVAIPIYFIIKKLSKFLYADKGESIG